MQNRNWLRAVAMVAVMRAMLFTAYAQPASTNAVHYGRPGFQNQLDKAVGLTPEQRDAVRGLLAQQRRDRMAIQEQTDAKIRALLNAEQQKKFDAFLSEQKQSRTLRQRPS